MTLASRPPSLEPKTREEYFGLGPKPMFSDPSVTCGLSSYHTGQPIVISNSIWYPDVNQLFLRYREV